MLYFNAMSAVPAFLTVGHEGGVRRQRDGFEQTKVVAFRNMTPRLCDFTLSLTVNKQRLLFSRCSSFFHQTRSPDSSARVSPAEHTAGPSSAAEMFLDGSRVLLGAEHFRSAMFCILSAACRARGKHHNGYYQQVTGFVNQERATGALQP